jgi:hypothetical protein
MQNIYAVFRFILYSAANAKSSAFSNIHDGCGSVK